MTATLTRTKTGNTKRVLKQAKSSLKESESSEESENQLEQHEDQPRPSPTEKETETPTERTDAAATDAEQPATHQTQEPATTTGAETTTPNTNDNSATMDATAMAAAIQQLTNLVTGLQADATTASSGKSRRKTPRRDDAGEQNTELATRESHRCIAIPDPPTATREAPTRTAPASASTATTERTIAAQTASTSELSAMAAAIRDLTTMVSGLQPVETHDGGRGRPAHRRTTRRPTHTRRETPDPSDNSSSSNHARHGRNRRSPRSKHRRSTGGADGDSSRSSDDSSSSSESEDERRTRVQLAERRERDDRVPGRRSVKDLELPAFTPSPKVSVSTWIDRVDLALKGAAKSGRGKWSDHALYFILGNKLMENAAKWWVNQDRRLKKRQRTWTNLKKALLRRYGPKLDKSNAELRVTMRRMMPGETYADFAAGLRDVVGRNRVKERVLLAQFLRFLDKTTKKLVQQRPKPKTLEEAVDKATEIDDPMDNVAQGMANIGQPWAVAPSHQLMMMTGMTGPMSVIHGISGTGLPTEMANAFEASGVALFTNPQGVWNEYSGTWDSLPGHAWNGKFLAETKQHELRR
ncbi:hypothetical protein PF008_g22327 [Phytophthora fragariae]|uniref:Retrotransposon gag domain-containing protein n=1 Tax=Phytophthora fragariae TaxID=53985 RepID=A0A6G0QUQ8_9STRA|nr:hypothetical protein PF008_g22327 [Phytophthora fragariae]